MLTTFDTLDLYTYFTIEDDSRIYFKADARNAWIFKGYYLFMKNMPLYECHVPNGGLKDIRLADGQVVTQCSVPK